jgi:hypothetical protein
VERLNFKASLKAIKRDLPIGFAETVVLVTERERYRTEVRNAELLNFFRRCPDEDADGVVAEILDPLTGETSIAELIEKTGLGARAFRGVFRAIYAGKLKANTREPISINSIVAPIGESA